MSRGLCRRRRVGRRTAASARPQRRGRPPRSARSTPSSLLGLQQRRFFVGREVPERVARNTGTRPSGTAGIARSRSDFTHVPQILVRLGCRASSPRSATSIESGSTLALRATRREITTAFSARAVRARDPREVCIGGEQLKLVVDAEQGQDGVDGGDLNPATTGPVAKLRGFDVIVTVGHQEGKGAEVRAVVCFSPMRSVAVPVAVSEIDEMLPIDRGEIVIARASTPSSCVATARAGGPWGFFPTPRTHRTGKLWTRSQGLRTACGRAVHCS